MARYFLYFLLIFLSFSSCRSTEVAESVDYYSNVPSELKPVFEVHGGLDSWNNMKALSFEKDAGDGKTELHEIDLHSRKARIKGDGYTIGYDGNEVWVSPNKSAYKGSSARFYHNLYFYFYAMPFVLADPGINYEILAPREILGKTYNQVSIRYGSGVGDAPEDEYIICYNPETNQMEWLLYTVTYYSKESSDNYRALHYDDWSEVNGLLLPNRMVTHKISNDTIMEATKERFFEKGLVSEKAFDQHIFEMPKEAEVDSLK